MVGWRDESGEPVRSKDQGSSWESTGQAAGLGTKGRGLDRGVED